MKSIALFLSVLCFSLFAAEAPSDTQIAPNLENSPVDRSLPRLKEPDSPVAPGERIYLLGDWGGERQRLEKKGFKVSLTYFSDILGNPNGGEKQGIAQTSSTGLEFTFDLDKLAKIKGLTLFNSFVFRFGTSLTRDKIHNQFSVAQLYGGQTYQLNELYLKKSFFDGNFILKAGRLDAANDFLQSELYYYYVNNALNGNPISVFYNSGFSSYPNATWGAYSEFKIEGQFKAQFGVYNVNPIIKENRYHGCNFTFESIGGIILSTQLNYLLNQAPGDLGLPGNYKVGFFYQTGEKEKFSGGLQKGNYSYYFLLDQSIYHQGDTWITPFISLVFAPQNRNLFPFFFNCGFTFDGLAKGRPDDSLSLGAACGFYSSDLRGDQPQDFEFILEANYWYYITKWIVVTPDIQYVIHPRGLTTIPNALVVGAQVGIVF